MPDVSTRELTFLLLDRYHEKENGVYPYEVSTTGITDVLEIGEENMSERMKLISTLSDMKQEGFIEERVGDVEGFEDQRNVYFLTDEGKKHVKEIQDQVARREITVRKEDEEYRAELRQVASEMSDGGLVRTLAKAKNGVLDLRESGVRDWFVDRDEELEILQNELVEVKRWGSRTVLISGESGIGKTALVSRFEEIADEEGFEFLGGKCPEGASEPYHSFRDAFDKYFEPDDLTLLDQEKSIVNDEDEVDAQKTALFHEVSDFVTQIASDNPLVVFIDDIHWMDRDSLELFDFLIENVEGEVVFVGCYQPETVPEDIDFVEGVKESVGDEGYRHIELENFGVDETREVIEWLVESGSVPQEFAEVIYEKTGGNPLFVRESVKQMIEENVIQPGEDVYPSKSYKIPVPERIEKTIERRLRSLDRTALEIVEWCGVIEDEISFELLNQVTETGESDLRDYLDVLRDTRVLSGSEDRYEFTNSVIKDTVLKNLSEEKEKELHRKVGDAIKDMSEGKKWKEYERIGYHYDEAGELEDAADFYCEAGDRARRTYALEKALYNYKRVLRIARQLGDDDASLSASIDIGHTQYLLGDYDEADRYFEYVWENSEDEEKLMEVSRYQARMRVNRGEHDKGIEMADRGLKEWDGETPSEEVRSLLSSKGWAVQEQGNLEEAAEIYEKELRIAEELGDNEHIGGALHDLGCLHMYRNEIEEAERVLKEAIEKLEESDNRHQLSKSINTLGIIYWKCGDLEKSRESFERSLEIDEEIGNKVGISKRLLNLGLISDVMGDWDGSLEYYEEALKRAENTGNKGTVANVSGNLGLIYRDRGELDKALENFERSIELSQELGIKRTEINSRSGLSKYYYAIGDFEKSVSQAEKALEIGEEADAKDKKIVGLNRLGRIELEKGNLERAREHHEKALELIEEGDERDKVDTRWSLVNTYLALGKVDEAHEVAEEAVKMAGEISDDLRKMSEETGWGMVMREKGEYDEAEEKLKSALERAREVGSKYDECDTLHQLGLLENKRGNEDIAREYFEKERKIAEECGFEIFKRKAEEGV